MKLDLISKKWLDIVFEGRNKAYGAYELRKDNTKTNIMAFIIGGFIFAFAVATPLLLSLIPDSSNDDQALNEKITTVKLPPKEDKPKENLKPPPPPPPKQDVVKFVKPVVAKTEDVHEDPPKMEDLKDKNLGKENIKGDPNADLDPGPVGDGPKQVEVVDDNTIYNSAGVEVQAGPPGGMDKFYKFVGSNFTTPEDCPGGKLLISFVIEKDGSFTDIKIVRDVCGAGKEGERVLKKYPKWSAAEQNGKKVRSQFLLPINIQATQE